jgi:hypothetical protein
MPDPTGYRHLYTSRLLWFCEPAPRKTHLNEMNAYKPTFFGRRVDPCFLSKNCRFRRIFDTPDTIQIKGDEFHPEWNYTISPQKK